MVQRLLRRPSRVRVPVLPAPEIADDDLALERTIPIGTVALDLPDDARLTSTGLEEEVGGLVTGLSFTIQSGDVECGPHLDLRRASRPRSGSATTRAPSAPSAATSPLEGVDIDRDEALVARFVPGDLDDQAHILLEESTSDVLDIACPDLATANALLERIHR